VGSLSGRDNLRSLAALRGLPAKRVDDVLRIVGLAGREDDKASTYSLGMKQRLGIAAALLPDPDLLVLDEPTEGLAPPPRCCRVGIVAVTFGRSRGGQGGGRSTLLLALACAGVWSRETGAKLTLAPAVIQITGWRARATKADRSFRNARLLMAVSPGSKRAANVRKPLRATMQSRIAKGA
jgi:hypothetical protein